MLGEKEFPYHHIAFDGYRYFFVAKDGWKSFGQEFQDVAQGGLRHHRHRKFAYGTHTCFRIHADRCELGAVDIYIQYQGLDSGPHTIGIEEMDIRFYLWT